ncbi:MAG TPA: CopG family transcriptional regulator [Phenylobacterium sp.]
MRGSEVSDEAQAAADAEAEADFRAGRVISHERMKTWLLSWGSANELPPPDQDA